MCWQRDSYLMAHVFLNGQTLASFLFIFGLVKQTITILTTNQCE